MNYDAIIFDLDGVICSTDEYHYQAWKHIAEKLNIPFDRTINNRLRGVSRMESLAIIMEGYTGPELCNEQLNEFAFEKNHLYRELLKDMTEADLSHEVKQTLTALRERGLLLGIGSSSKNTPMILTQLGLGQFFDAVSDGNQITRSKPDPEVFQKAAELLHVSPTRCLVVEDAVSGATAGYAAGMKVACVGDAAQKKVGDYNLSSFSALLDLIAG